MAPTGVIPHAEITDARQTIYTIREQLEK